MVLFPVVSDDGRDCIFIEIKLLPRPAGGVKYYAMYDDDERDDETDERDGGMLKIYIEDRLKKDVNMLQSITNAISLSSCSGYLTITNDAGLNGRGLVGASLGVAVAVECCRPGVGDGIAFTGFVTNMNKHDGTCWIHEIDNLDKKIALAIKKGQRMIVPYQPNVLSRVGAYVPCSKNLVSPVKRDLAATVWSVCTLMEVFEAITMIKNGESTMGASAKFENEKVNVHYNKIKDTILEVATNMSKMLSNGDRMFELGGEEEDTAHMVYKVALDIKEGKTPTSLELLSAMNDIIEMKKKGYPITSKDISGLRTMRNEVIPDALTL